MISLAQYSYNKKKTKEEASAQDIHDRLSELMVLMQEDERFRELGYTLETVDNYVVRHLA